MGAADRALPGELRKTNKDAAEIVARRVRAKATSLGGVQAKVAPSVKARGEQRNAKILFGGPKFPMAMGANFGAKWHDAERIGPSGRIYVGFRQFPDWSGNQHAWGGDQFLYDQIGATRDEFIDTYGDMLDDLLDRIARH